MAGTNWWHTYRGCCGHCTIVHAFINTPVEWGSPWSDLKVSIRAGHILSPSFLPSAGLQKYALLFRRLFGHSKETYTVNYSRVRNKHTPTLINFLTFFQGLRPLFRIWTYMTFYFFDNSMKPMCIGELFVMSSSSSVCSFTWWELSTVGAFSSSNNN